MDSNLSSTFISDVRPLLNKQLNGIRKTELKKILQKINPTISFATSSKNQLINGITKQLFVNIEKFKDSNGGVTEALEYLKNWFLAELGQVIKNPSYQSLEAIISTEFKGLNDSSSRSLKNPKNNQTLVNNIWTDKKFQQYPCVCLKVPASLREPKQQQNCYKCGVSFHPICLWGRSKDIKLSDTLPECPSCYLINCLPQKKVEKVLFAGYLPTIKLNKIEFVIEFPMPLEIKNEKKMIIQARCMRINSSSDHNRYQLTWPDNSTVFLNSKKISQYKPLTASSALKRRTDEELVLDKSYIYCDIPERLVIQEKHQREGSSSKYEYADHFVMIFAVSLQKKEDLLAMFNQSRLSVQQSKQILKNYLSCKNSNDIQVQKLSVSLMCPFYSNKISIPVRSKHCSTHFQPFDLNNFIEVNKTTGKGIVLKYKCPICKKRAYDLVVDEYLQDLITSKDNGQNFSQITFRADGQPHFEQEDVSQAESQEDNDNNNNNNNKQEEKQEMGNDSVQLIPLQVYPENEVNLNEQQLQTQQKQQNQQNQIILIDLQEEQQQQPKSQQKQITTIDRQICQTISTSSLMMPENNSTTINNTIISSTNKQFPLKRRQPTQKQLQQKQQQLLNSKSSQQVMTEIIRKHVKKSQTQRQIKKLLANKLVTTQINSKPKLNGQLSQEQLQSQNVINQLRQPEIVRVFGVVGGNGSKDREKEKDKDDQANKYNSSNSKENCIQPLNQSTRPADDKKPVIQKRDTDTDINNQTNFIKKNVIYPLTQPLKPLQFGQKSLQQQQHVQQKQTTTQKYPLEPIEISSDQQQFNQQHQQEQGNNNNKLNSINSNDQQRVQKPALTLMNMKHRLYEINKIVTKNIKKSLCNQKDKEKQRQKEKSIPQSSQKRVKLSQSRVRQSQKQRQTNSQWQRLDIPSSKCHINSSSSQSLPKLGLQSLLINTTIQNSRKERGIQQQKQQQKQKLIQDKNQEDHDCNGDENQDYEIIFQQQIEYNKQKDNNNQIQLQQAPEETSRNDNNNNFNESQQSSSYSFVVQDIRKQSIINSNTIISNNNNISNTNNNKISNNNNKTTNLRNSQHPILTTTKPPPELKRNKPRNYIRQINHYLKAGDDYNHNNNGSGKKKVKTDNNNPKQLNDNNDANIGSQQNECLDETIYEESEDNGNNNNNKEREVFRNNKRKQQKREANNRTINNAINSQGNTSLILSHNNNNNNTINKYNTFDNPIELVDSEQEDQKQEDQKVYVQKENNKIQLQNHTNHKNNIQQQQQQSQIKDKQKDKNHNLNQHNQINHTKITTTYEQQLKQLRQQMEKNRQKTQKYSKLYNIRSITEDDQKVFFQLLQEVNSLNNYEVF